MATRWLVLAVLGCASRAPAPIAHTAPPWSACLALIESSVRADAHGVDRLVVAADDTLRSCWHEAIRVVDDRRRGVPAASCRALRLAEPAPSPTWFARCRRFEVDAPPGRKPDERRARSTAEGGAEIDQAVARRTGRPIGGRANCTVDCPDEQPDRPAGVIGLEPAAAPESLEPIVRRRVDADGTTLITNPARAPATPTYDLTPAARGVCAAVAEVVDHFAARPSPELPLVVERRWTNGAWTIAWPESSAIAPVEDALVGCLAGWTLDTAASPERRLRWAKAGFTVELVTSPGRRLTVARP